MIEVGCEGPTAFIAGLAGPINELAAIVNRSLFAARTFQTESGDREIRYFMTQQIDEVGKRGLVDGGYFTVGEIVVALRTAENPARHRVPPWRRNRDRHPPVTGSSASSESVWEEGVPHGPMRLVHLMHKRPSPVIGRGGGLCIDPMRLHRSSQYARKRRLRHFSRVPKGAYQPPGLRLGPSSVLSAWLTVYSHMWSSGTGYAR